MPTWTVIGEAGKTLDNTERSLAALDVKAATVTFRSLDADTFVFSQEIEASTLIAEKGQTVTLERDGVVFFYGVVTGSDESYSAGSWSVTTTVSGPWWYAENIALTYPTGSPAGGTADRQTLQYGSNQLASSITATINRGTTLGVPWQLGTISTFFTFPQITLNQNSVAGALAELVRMCPDAMVWFDYSFSPAKINVTRRGSASSETITIGTDNVVSYSIKPMTELKVTGVKLPYATRAFNGKRAWAEQSAGGGANVQVLTISGPELDTYLPPDPPTESVTLTTISTGSIGSAFNPMANTTNPTLLGLIQKYGTNWYGTSGGASSIQAGVGNGAQIRFYQQSSGGVGQTFTPARPTFLDENGQPVTGHFLYPGTSIPDWIAPLLGGTKVTYQYVYYVYHRWNSSISSTEPYFPGLADFYSGAASAWEDYFTQESTYNRISIYYAVFSGEGLVLPSSYTNYTQYRPPEYTFLAPPSGFASNMLSAQNWLPYEGSIESIYEDAGGTRFRGKVLNVANSRLSEHASMNALVESEGIDLMTGETSVGIGCPPRINYRTLLDKVRRTPQDNIFSSAS